MQQIHETHQKLLGKVQVPTTFRVFFDSTPVPKQYPQFFSLAGQKSDIKISHSDKYFPTPAVHGLHATGVLSAQETDGVFLSLSLFYADGILLSLTWYNVHFGIIIGSWNTLTAGGNTFQPRGVALSSNSNTEEVRCSLLGSNVLFLDPENLLARHTTGSQMTTRSVFCYLLDDSATEKIKYTQ